METTRTIEFENDSTADRILKAAVPLFAEKGYAGVSVREIVKAADVSNVGAVSYYFGGKEGLYLAILRQHFERVHRLAHKIHRDTDSPVEKLKLIFRAIGETYQNSPYTARLLFNGINQPGKFSPEINKGILGIQQISKDILADGIKRGIFRQNMDLGSMALVLHSIAQFAFLMPSFSRPLLPEGEDAFHRYLEQAMACFFSGILAGGSQG